MHLTKMEKVIITTADLLGKPGGMTTRAAAASHLPPPLSVWNTGRGGGI